MKFLILYTTKTGSTKQYSEWLHEEFPDSEIYDIANFDTSKFQEYDLIVAASPTYGGQMPTIDFLKGNYELIKDKKVYLMAVGAIPQETSWSKKSYNRIPQNLRDIFIGYIKLPGLSDKVEGFGKIIFKLFLKVDPDTLEVRKEIKRSDLQPVIEFLRNYK